MPLVDLILSLASRSYPDASFISLRPTKAAETTKAVACMHRFGVLYKTHTRVNTGAVTTIRYSACICSLLSRRWRVQLLRQPPQICLRSRPTDATRYRTMAVADAAAAVRESVQQDRKQGGSHRRFGIVPSFSG